MKDVLVVHEDEPSEIVKFHPLWYVVAALIGIVYIAIIWIPSFAGLEQ